MTMNVLTNRDLFSIFRDSNINFRDFKEVWELVLEKNLFDITNIDENEEVLKAKLKMFCINLTNKWEKSNRTIDRFLKNHDNWLNNKLSFFSTTTSSSPSTSSSSKPSRSSSKTSRKEWAELSDRQKRRRTEALRETESQELLHAMKSKAYVEKNTDLYKILDCLEKNPTYVKKVREFCENDCTVSSKQMSRDKALAMFISLHLSKSKYISLREVSAESSMNIYPSYYQIKLAKAECYPPKSDIVITDVSACIKLQSLLDLTVQRIFKACGQNYDESRTLKFIYKWGFDGASSQSLYKQTFADSFQEKSDASIFMTSLVPLKLFDDSTIIWQNKKPSSTWYCRPIRFEFAKETAEIINTERDRMQNEIDELVATKIQNVTVEHELLFTMIDGKICSTLSATSFAVCYICGAKPSEMNDLKRVANKIVKKEHLKYGLSSLHAWIRSLEFLLHVAYNLDFKQWSARTPENKASKIARKKKIQEGLRNELGILVHVVKEGSGTTNDGNTARKFFENPEKTAKIIGLDASLIRRFAIILQAIASGEQIEPTKFDNFAKGTASLFVDLYGWYFMPVSIHKILLHGSAIIENALLPIGQLSEEAAEARNKEFRKTREQHTRKLSRQITNEDIMQYLLVSSDPYITSLRPNLSKTKKKAFFPEVLDLLVLSRGNEISTEFDSADNDSGDDYNL